MNTAPRPPRPGLDPWFAASGLSAFAGCALVSWAAHQRPDELAPPAVALAVFTLYQLLVLGVALWLNGRGRRAPARQLAVLLVLLLPDSCLLVSELVTAAPAAGVPLAAAGAGLAAGGAAVAARVLRIRWAPWTLAAGLTGLAVAFGAPLAARLSTDSGFLGGGAVYAGGWALGLLAFVGLGAATARRIRPRAAGFGPPRRTAHRAEKLVAAVAVGSGLLHLAVLAVVYEPDVRPHDLSPLMLGLTAVAWWRTGPPRFAGSFRPGDRRSSLATAAVSAALGLWLASTSRGTPLGPEPLLSPPAVWLAAFTAVALLIGVVQRRAGLIAAGLVPPLCLLGWSVRGPVRAASGAVASAWEAAGPVAGRARGFLWAMAPRGPLAWGGVLLGLAFALLGVGAWRARRPDPRTADGRG